LRSIVWFRHNLRLSDNPPLYQAAREGPVLPVYIWDPSLDTLPDGARKWWLAGSLRALNGEFLSHGLTLVLLRGPSEEILFRLARDRGIGAVHASPGRTPEERSLDQRVAWVLSGAGISFRTESSDYLVPPEFVPEGRSGPWKIFTPFWRSCRSRLPPDLPLPAPGRIAKVPAPRGERLGDWGWDPPAPDWAHTMRRLWRPGEAAAHERLGAFVAENLAGYGRRRDFPADAATSKLSPHLATGEISPRQIWWMVSESEALEKDQEKFLEELGWREFSAHLLWHYPEMMESPLRRSFLDYPWETGGREFELWKRGMTGFPLVDAGMRELRQTGGMTNRVRMVAASFLVKNLGISWRSGAAWFADNLVDYDPASNFASWQWVAGCGTDSAPFFRVFNPVLQGERYDPRGEYVRRFVPELARIPDRFVHRPWMIPGSSEKKSEDFFSSYPDPIVELATSRNKALQAFRRLLTPG